MTNCSTINEFKESGRYKVRYVVSTRTDGLFKVNRNGKEYNETLNVCKNCLKAMNYQSYNDFDYEKKEKIYNNFTLKEYFDHYKTSDLDTSNLKTDKKNHLNRYFNDGQEIKAKKQSFEGLEKEIYDYLKYHNSPQSKDQLSVDLNIPISKLSVELFNMELKGVLKKLSSGMYELILN